MPHPTQVLPKRGPSDRASFRLSLESDVDFATLAQARAAVFTYIEAFYNRVRIHATLGYLSPEQFEAARAARA